MPPPSAIAQGQNTEEGLDSSFKLSRIQTKLPNQPQTTQSTSLNSPVSRLDQKVIGVYRSRTGLTGVSSNASHPSLPARPPQPSKPAGFKSAFKPVASSSYPVNSVPAYSNVTTPYSAAPSYGTAAAPGGYGAGYGTAAAPGGYGGGYGASPATTSYPNPSLPVVGGPHGGYNQTASYGGYPQQSYQQPTYYGAGSTNNTNYAAAPQIRNPFPAPNANPHPTAVDGYNPETAAQIAQWQSAYMPKDPSDPANKGPSAASNPGARYGAAAYPGPQVAVATPAEAADPNAGATNGEKKKTVYREGGGKRWQDDTLLEWDPAHQRLFVGNLAGETTDDSLLKAFSRWPSVVKAKVIRDKITTKSKGFGFVSFSNVDDFFQAAKEMQGKYIQSHPVTIRKANTIIDPKPVHDPKRGKNNKKGGKNNKNNKDKKSGNGTGGNNNGGYEPHLGVQGGSGVTKPGQKTRGGLKLLG